jgi:hypothetical protein
MLQKSDRPASAPRDDRPQKRDVIRTRLWPEAAPLSARGFPVADRLLRRWMVRGRP